MKYDFIEIGTSDFDTILETCPDNSIGLSVDPVLYYLDRLPSKPQVHKLLSAISDIDGFTNIFYVPEDIISKYNLPWWVRGCNSINSYHPTVVTLLKSAGVEPSTAFVSKKIPQYSMPTLLQMYQVESCTVLKVDTEGHDCVILSSYLKAIHEGITEPAKTIIFESNVLTNRDTVTATINRFKLIGYSIKEQNDNTILVRV